MAFRNRARGRRMPTGGQSSNNNRSFLNRGGQGFGANPAPMTGPNASVQSSLPRGLAGGNQSPFSNQSPERQRPYTQQGPGAQSMPGPNAHMNTSRRRGLSGGPARGLSGGYQNPFSNQGPGIKRGLNQQGPGIPTPAPGIGPNAHVGSAGPNMLRAGGNNQTPFSNQSPEIKRGLNQPGFGNLGPQSAGSGTLQQQQSPGQWAGTIKRNTNVNQDGSIYGGPNNQGGFNNQPGRFSPGYSGKGLRPTGLPNAPGLRKPGSGGSRVMNTPTAGGFRNRLPKNQPNQPGNPNFLRPGTSTYEEGY